MKLSNKKKFKANRKPKEIALQFHLGLGSALYEVNPFPLCHGRQEMPVLAYANLTCNLLPMNNMTPTFSRAQFWLRGWNYSLSQPLPSRNVLLSISKWLAQECTSFIRGDLICWIWQTLKYFRSIHSETMKTRSPTLPVFSLSLVTGSLAPVCTLEPSYCPGD